MLGQFAVGVVGAWVGGILLFQAVDDPEGPGRKVKGDAGYTPNANTAFALGSWFGSAAAVYFAGNRPRECGSFTKAVIGAGVPTVPLLFWREEPYLPIIGVVFFAPLQSAGATVAY